MSKIDKLSQRKSETMEKNFKKQTETRTNGSNWLDKKYEENFNEWIRSNGKNQIHNMWEHAADKKSMNSQVKFYADRIMQQRKEDTHKRKQRLKELYENEIDMYAYEMSHPPESSSNQKHINMLNRYADITANKELECQKVAEEKKELQFRRNFHMLRDTFSKSMQGLVKEDRKALADVKSRLDKEKEIEDKMYHEAWIKDMEAKEKKQNEKELREEERNRKFWKSFEDERKTHEPSISVEDGPITEAQLRLEQNHLLEIEKQWEKSQKVMRQEKITSDLDSCLKDKLNRRANEVQKDLMPNLYFLEQITDKNSEEACRREKKKINNQEQKDYLNYLDNRKKLEAEYEKQLGKMQEEDMKRIWEEEEEILNDERKMREVMNKTIAHDNERHSEEKRELNRQALQQEMRYTEQIKQQDAKDNEDIGKEKQERRERNIANQCVIQEQIRQKMEGVQIAKEKKKEEYEEFERAEEKCNKKVQEELLADPVAYPHLYRTPKH